MKIETKFSRHLIAELLQQTNEIPHQICRIESGTTHRGIPDIYCCVNGSSFWIETKSDIGELNPFQKAWHEAHYGAGGTSFVINEKGTSSLKVIVRNILRQVEENAAIGYSKDKKSTRTTEGNS